MPLDRAPKELRGSSAISHPEQDFFPFLKNHVIDQLSRRNLMNECAYCKSYSRSFVRKLHALLYNPCFGVSCNFFHQTRVCPLTAPSSFILCSDFVSPNSSLKPSHPRLSGYLPQNQHRLFLGGTPLVSFFSAHRYSHLSSKISID